VCMIDGADLAVVCSESWRRARKQHRCCECSRIITAGERYRYAFVVSSDHESNSYHTCAGCAAAQDWLQVECGGWLFNGVAEDIAQHVESGVWSDDEERWVVKPTRQARLLVGIRRKWRRFDGIGIMTVGGTP